MLGRIEFEFEEMTDAEAKKVQYTLGTEIAVYRAFIDAGRKRGYIVYDKEQKTMDEITSAVAHGIKIKEEREFSLEDLITESLSK